MPEDVCHQLLAVPWILHLFSLHFGFFIWKRRLLSLFSFPHKETSKQLCMWEVIQGNTEYKLISKVSFIQWTLYKCWLLLLLWPSSKLYVYHFFKCTRHEYSGAKLNLLHDINSVCFILYPSSLVKGNWRKSIIVKICNNERRE